MSIDYDFPFGGGSGVKITQYTSDRSVLFTFTKSDGTEFLADPIPEEMHALADWIIANVPKPEPTPLPTKFAAVVKSEDMLWTHAEPHTARAWIAENGDWSTGEEIRAEGFEVIFAGVEDDTEAAADEGVDD